MNATARGPRLPWYREPWPWLLMAGPAVVVLAGAVTVWLAIRSADGLVADDYYKQGLAINQVLARVERAQALQLAAEVRISADQLEIGLRSGAEAELPPHVRATLSHATQTAQDRNLLLQAVGGGVYRAVLDRMPTGRWQIALEDEAKTWRIAGVLRLPDESVTTISAAASVQPERGR